MSLIHLLWLKAEKKKLRTLKSKLEEVINRLEEAIEEIKDTAFAVEEANPNDEVRSIM